jgi:hypothetical protein
MLTLMPCPECGSPAEVTDRFVLNGTDGPVDHLALRCVAFHHFRMPVESLTAQSRNLLSAQSLGPAAHGNIDGALEPWMDKA